MSFDGGVNWERAELERLSPLEGVDAIQLQDASGVDEPWLLQSRAIDETGYVQPTLKQLRDERGGWSIYHKNSIHTWNVTESWGRLQCSNLLILSVAAIALAMSGALSAGPLGNRLHGDD